MTTDEVVDFFEGNLLHVWDGSGDACTGHDEKALRQAAEEMVAWHRRAVAEEREACARVADEASHSHDFYEGAAEVARRIRGRTAAGQ